MLLVHCKHLRRIGPSLRGMSPRSNYASVKKTSICRWVGFSKTTKLSRTPSLPLVTPVSPGSPLRRAQSLYSSHLPSTCSLPGNMTQACPCSASHSLSRIVLFQTSATRVCQDKTWWQSRLPARLNCAPAPIRLLRSTSTPPRKTSSRRFLLGICRVPSSMMIATR